MSDEPSRIRYRVTVALSKDEFLAIRERSAAVTMAEWVRRLILEKLKEKA